MNFNDNSFLSRIITWLWTFPVLIIFFLLLYIICLIVNPPLVALIVFLFIYIIFPIKLVHSIYVSLYMKNNIFLYTLKSVGIYFAVSFILFGISNVLHKKLYIQSLSGDISEKGEYSIIYLNKIKEKMIRNIIARDKEARKVILSNKGKNKFEVENILNKLEKEYRYEEKKLYYYCSKKSTNCKINISVKYENWYSKIILSPEKIDSSITYKFDIESLKFFNSNQYVGNNYLNYHIDEEKFYYFSWTGYKAIQYKPTDEEVTLYADSFSDNFIEIMEEEQFLMEKSRDSTLIPLNRIIKTKNFALKVK